MANTVKVKRSATPSKVPTTSDLDLGEIAVNTYDGKMYIKKDDGTASVVEIGGTAGSGDVVGPASATDNAVARFDTTTGKLIQNSVVTIDDAGSIENAIIDSFTNTVGADHIHYKIKANETIAKGNILKYVGWNAGNDAIEVVKVSSATDVAIGMAHDDLATGEFGLAVVVGTTEGFDTSAFTAGTILYPNTSGGLTATKPTSGTYQACAFVIRSQAINGAYLVNFSNPVYVEASTNTANTAVIRDGSGNFSAGTITAALAGNATTATTLATGRTIGITGDLTYTSPSFNGSGNVTAAGTLATVNSNVGSFTNASVTVNAKGLVTAVSSGTAPVTSVTGTAPIASSGGATPAISISQATTSTNGYLSSTDWNTFNGKQAALVSGTNIKTVNGTTLLGSGNLAVGTVTSVTATSPVASTGGATPVISMPAATTSVSGYLTSTDWNTFNSKTSNTGTVTSVAGTGTVSGLTLTGTVTTSGSLTLGGTLSLTSGNVTTALGYTPYNATNPNSYIALGSAITGYTAGTNTALVATDTLLAALGKLQGQVSARTSNTGTVTSVAGTGTASGLSLSGTVTTSGNITLSGTVNSLAAGTYGISISGSSASCTGNAATATTATNFAGIPAGTAMLFYQSAAPTGWTQVTTQNNKALRVVSGTGGGTGGSVAFSTAFASQAVSGTVSTTNTATTATMASYTPTGSISVSVGAGTLAVGAGTFAVGATTLSTSQMPSHNHQGNAPLDGFTNTPFIVAGGRTQQNSNYQNSGNSTSSTGGGGSHTHSLTGAPSISGAPSVTSSSFTGNAATLTQNSHNHTASSSFSGTAINLAVQYIDVIICSKN